MASETKHTPGPWTVYEAHDRSLFISRGPAATDVRIAKILNSTAVGPVRVRMEADARLIAVAPKMLDELKDLVSLIAAEYPKQQHVWLEGARDIIAKAEGK